MSPAVISLYINAFSLAINVQHQMFVSALSFMTPGAQPRLPAWPVLIPVPPALKL